LLVGKHPARQEVAGVADEDAHPEWRSDMVDVSGMTLTELVELTEDDDSALAHSLRRLADDLARPGEPVAGFNSAL
jgi:FXSXX-COOH protein